MKKYIIPFLLLMLGHISIQANIITVDNIVIRTGESCSASIALENSSDNLVGFQMDITLPEGISINNDECQLSGRFQDQDQQLIIGDLGNNTYRLTTTSLSLHPITDNSGEIITLSLGANDMTDGGKVTIGNIRFVTSQSERIYLSEAEFTIQIVDITPAIAFDDNTVKSLCLSKWDVNGDGEISMREAAKVTDLESLFQGNTTITSFYELKYFTGLTSIAENEFQGCSGLLSVSIPENVQQIGSYSFNGCNNLKSVYAYMKTPPSIAETTFSSQGIATLFVTRNYQSGYTNAEVWKNFYNIIAMVFNHGDGTEENPYLLYNPSDFLNLANDVNAGTSYEGVFFKVAKPEIDFSGVTYIPIGESQSSSFSGTFDGQNTIIKGLSFYKSSGYSGIFGYVSNKGHVSNIIIDESCSFQGLYDLGGIVGANEGLISNCINKGAVSSSKYRVGGICGDNMGIIENCTNYGTIQTSNTDAGFLGGIAGDCDKGVIRNSTNYGKISGPKAMQIGGIVGLIETNTQNRESIIEGCTNKGDVEGDWDIGGIAGDLGGTYHFIRNCLVSACTIKATQTGGAINGSAGGTLSENYYTSDVVVIEGSVTYDGLKARGIPGNKNITKDNGAMIQYDINALFDYNAEGHYEIKSVKDMVTLRDLVNELDLSCEGMTFKVTAKELNFDYQSLTLGTCIPSSYYYNGVSYDKTYKPFSGTFDGNGVLIKRLLINNNNNEIKNGFGLFAYNKGTIKNIVLDESCTIQSAAYAPLGGIVAVNEGVIEGCTNKATINGMSEIGGIAGINRETIQNCTNSGVINGYGTIGGITGNNNGTIIGCANSGDITGPSQSSSYTYNKTKTIAGIAGNNTGTLSDNIVIGGVFSNASGFVVGTNTGTLQNNLYSSNVTGETGINYSGSYDGDITTNYGAVKGTAILAGENVKIVNATSENGGLIFYNNIPYAYEGLTINLTLEYEGEVPANYDVEYWISGYQIVKNEDGTYPVYVSYYDRTIDATLVEKPAPNLEYGEIKPDELGVTDEGTVLAAGTILCETENIVCKTGAEDTYWPQPVQVSVNGTEISGGIQGNTNPHDEDSGTPSTSLKQPTSGAFLQFEAKADGFLYIPISASSNKAYTVFENGTAIGYTFSAIGNADPLPEVYSYTLAGTGEQNRLMRPVNMAEQEYLKIANPDAYESRWTVEDETKTWNPIKASGTGVIAFPVHNGSSYIVNANGSKISAGGYYFDETNEVTFKSGEVTIFNKDTWTENIIDNTLVAEKDWSGVKDDELPWIQFAGDDESGYNGSAAGSADGVAITVDTNVGEIWQPQANVLEGFTLQKNHSYKVIFTAKIPNDGQLQANFGSWGTSDQYAIPVTASNEFQNIEFTFESFPENTEEGHVLFQCGELLGTTIVKHVKVIDLGIIPADLTYNFNDENKTAELIQNPVRKYYGAVNIPATVTHEGEVYSVTKIADDAFSDCVKLTSVRIPASVTSLSPWSFNNCEALSEIIVDQGNKVYDSRDNCNAIIETTVNRLVASCVTTLIPNTVEIIGEACFWNHWKMTSIDLPESLKELEWGAFGWCSNLQSITIPAGVTSIGDCAFVGCGSLVSVTVKNSTPVALKSLETFINKDEHGEFTSETIDATLYVPLGSEAAYRNADYWKAFKTITSSVDNAVYAEAQTGNMGRPFTMNIKLKNENAVRAYSFDLQLPQGVTIAKNGDDYEIELSGRHDSYTPTVNYDESTNTYKLATTSRVVGNDGVIMTLRLQVSDLTPIGEYVILISNAIYTQAENYQDVHMPETSAKLTIGEKTYTKGDVNDDDDVDIADVVCVVNHVVGIETPSYFETAADVNGDNNVTISDAAKLIDYIIGEIETLDPAAARSLSLTRASSNHVGKTRSLDTSSLDDALYASDLTVKPGNETPLAISLKNALATNGYSFDLILPDGVTLAKDGNGKYRYELSGRHDKSHEVHINYKEATRTYSVAVYSQSSKVLSDNDGVVLTFTLAVTDAMSYAGATASIQNAKYSKTDGSGKVTLPREEVKLSRSISMTEVMKMMSYILGENPEGFNVDAADMNGDGEVTITDVLMVLDLLKQSGE